MKISALISLLASLTIEVAAQGGSSGGGWYVVNESLVCYGFCDPNKKSGFSAGLDDKTINDFCRDITNDCADGVLSLGQRSKVYGPANNGLIGTAAFGAGPAHGNNGCPNYNDCFESFKYLSMQMRYPHAPGSPNPYCQTASIVINGHYNHLKTGVIMVTLPTIRVGPPIV